MKDFTKLLVPTDFSSHAEHAAEWALGFAQKTGAEVRFLHVYDYPSYVLPDGALLPAADVISNLLTDVQEHLDALQAKYGQLGVTTSAQARQGVPVTEIVLHAREWGADLIVVGTHGRSGLQHFLIGSVAEKVVRKATCPVVTVRPPGFTTDHPEG